MNNNNVFLKTKEKRHYIQALYKAGHSAKEISKCVGVSRNTVKRWRNRKSIENKKGSGRPTKLSRYDKKQIYNILYQNYDASIRKTAKIINSESRNKRKNKTICPNTIQNYIKSTEWGKKAYKSPKKQKLSEKNIKERLKFGEILDSNGYLTEGRLGKEKRAHILFSDETFIEIDTYSQRKNKRFRTENIKDVPPTLLPKYNLKVLIAGAICAKGKSKLIFIPQEQKINGEYYRKNILTNYIDLFNQSSIFPKKSLRVLMQDSATPHTQKETIEKLKEAGLDLIGGKRWPGNSPDLNPIENLWGILKNSIYYEPIPSTIDEIKTRFQSSWDNYPIEGLEKLVESFKDRVEKMMKADGGHF